MNLLNKIIPKEMETLPEDLCVVRDFRKNQFNLLPEFIETSMNYLNKISNNYIRYKKLIKKPIIKYQDAYGYSLDKYTILIENPDEPSKDQVFLIFNLPSLIKNNYFYLNGSNYVPCLYILDKPIIYKKSSIKLDALLNPITIYFKSGNTRAIFGGKNIPIEYFLQWFLEIDPDLLDEVETQFKLSNHRYSKTHLLKYFSKFFGCEEDELIINNWFNDLFFDTYTQDLYKKSYGIDFTFPDLVHYSIRHYIDDEPPHFVDLNNKRLILMEILLTPIFRRISEMAFNFCHGQKFSGISMNDMEVVKYYMGELQHKFYYDLCNLYSGITTHKATFLSPNTSVPPSGIASIHTSHFKRICPITISAQRPGEVVSIVPSTLIYKKFGLFK